MKAKELKIKYKLHLDEKVIEQSLENLATGKSLIFGVSGKMGSGKDTLGNNISKEIASRFKIFPTSVSFALSLRNELSKIFKDFDLEVSLKSIQTKYKANESDILKLYECFKVTKQEKVSEPIENAPYVRAPIIRKAMQFWGDVRRAEDINYWVSRTIEEILMLAYTGAVIYVPDVRQFNEAEVMKDINAKVIRLEVSENVRIERLIDRDGYKPSDSALNHISEIDLDDYLFDFALYDNYSNEDLMKAYEYLNLSILGTA